MIKYSSFIKELQINNIVKKKALNNLLFKKSIIRSSLVKKPNIYLVDNYTKISLFNTNIVQKGFFETNKLNDLSGLSINTREIKYVHNLNSFLKFKMDTIFFNKIKTGFLNSIYTFIDSLVAFRVAKTKKIKKLLSKKKKSKAVNLLLLKPIKGGFLAYSLGFKGFFPLKHIKIYLSTLFKSFKKYFSRLFNLTKKRDMIFYNFTKSSILKESFQTFRFPIILIDTRFSSSSKVRKYSKKKSKKVQRRNLNSFTIVFLTKLKKNYSPLKHLSSNLKSSV